MRTSACRACAATRHPSGANPRRRFAAALVVSALFHAACVTLATAPGVRGSRSLSAPSAVTIAARLVAARPDTPLPPLARELKPAAAPAPRMPQKSLPQAVTAPRPRVPPNAGTEALPEAQDPTYYSARQLDVYPTLQGVLELAFPSAAPDDAAGHVLLLVLIDANGSIDNVSVVEATPAGLFDDVARKALAGARFTPALKSGRPVKSRLLVRVSYDARAGATP